MWTHCRLLFVTMSILAGCAPVVVTPEYSCEAEPMSVSQMELMNAFSLYGETDVNQDGHPCGVRLSRLMPPQWWFLAGDVIRDVDGIPIDGPSELWSAIRRSCRQGCSPSLITFQGTRDGKSREWVVSVIHWRTLHEPELQDMNWHQR